MTLEEIAAGIEVVDRQREHGVAATDDTGESLVDRLSESADALPCTPAAAATILETHAAGASVGESAREAGVVPITASKVLHRCGADSVSPLSPTARDIVRDWIAGDLPRSEAMALIDATEAEFALATYIETHEADDRLAAIAADVLATHSETGADGLAETLPEPDEFL